MLEARNTANQDSNLRIQGKMNELELRSTRRGNTDKNLVYLIINGDNWVKHSRKLGQSLERIEKITHSVTIYNS